MTIQQSNLLHALIFFALVGQGCGFASHVQRSPLDIMSLSATKEATFGMGCFWEPAESLLKQPGVLATTVGYTGAPVIVYDDDIISYTKLLDNFFEYQKPGYSRQYASVIFTNDDEEESLAIEWKEDNASKQTKTAGQYNLVDIEPSSAFYKAEEYHQRYWEKQRLRALLAVLLIAGESGAYDNLFGGVLTNVQVFDFTFDTICGGVFLVGAAWMILERLVARDVRELKSGDLMAMALQE